MVVPEDVGSGVDFTAHVVATKPLLRFLERSKILVGGVTSLIIDHKLFVRMSTVMIDLRNVVDRWQRYAQSVDTVAGRIAGPGDVRTVRH